MLVVSPNSLTQKFIFYQSLPLAEQNASQIPRERYRYCRTSNLAGQLQRLHKA
jgi:hypothetical protein